MKQIILKHGEMITVVGALVGIGAFGYGTFRFFRSEDRARLETNGCYFPRSGWIIPYCILLWYSQKNIEPLLRRLKQFAYG